MCLLYLPAELLVAIASQLAEDDELAATLACRKLSEAVAGTERRASGKGLSPSINSAFYSEYSVRKVEWAVSLCGLPLGGHLLTRAARHGQLEQLSWLRARGCPWGRGWSVQLPLALAMAMGGEWRSKRVRHSMRHSMSMSHDSNQHQHQHVWPTGAFDNDLSPSRFFILPADWTRP
jgi:hypothetical protein